ncbi:MAG: sigma-70 family RNA polymerase sigma factor, partial [Verrucomicrobiales bacterium]|nr:sigma-70 family RNA polymerase sigma factor [Verrucomicrobiales bacterium]
EQCKRELPHRVDAYNEIVERFRPLVLNRCMTMIRSRMDAEEVCQDVFVQVFRKIHQFQGRSAFSTWLYRIVCNMCMSRGRVLCRRSEKQNEFAEQTHIEESANSADAGIDELCENVQEALNLLDGEKRDIVAKRFVKGLSLQEIAEEKNLKLSATKMRLYRALDDFRAAYLKTTAEATS